MRFKPAYMLVGLHRLTRILLRCDYMACLEYLNTLYWRTSFRGVLKKRNEDDRPSGDVSDYSDRSVQH